MAKVYCDRHRGLVDGIEDEHVTGGFYRRSGWPEFFDAGEERVCDDCMFADPRYVKVYGRHGAQAPVVLSMDGPCKVALKMCGVTYTMDAVVESFDVKADRDLVDVTTIGDDYERFRSTGVATARLNLRGYGIERAAA